MALRAAESVVPPVSVMKSSVNDTLVGLLCIEHTMNHELTCWKNEIRLYPKFTASQTLCCVHFTRYDGVEVMLGVLVQSHALPDYFLYRLDERFVVLLV